jgi:hypothetical protein
LQIEVVVFFPDAKAIGTRDLQLSFARVKAADVDLIQRHLSALRSLEWKIASFYGQGVARASQPEV